MAAVIRVKRRVDEDPHDAFVLNCKKRKVGAGESSQAAPSSSTDECSTVLKFAGTFEKADNIPSHLQQRLTKEEAKDAVYRIHRPTILSRNRKASRQTTQNSRFRIVNCTRSLDQVDGPGGTTIVDVEYAAPVAPALPDSTAAGTSKQETTEKPQTQTPQDEEYVYDLYVADEIQQSTHIPYIPDNLEDISVAIHDDPFGNLRNDEGSDDSMFENESEDSNDENNWRNDYPDEEDDDDEVDMRRAMDDFNLASDPDLSSEDDYYSGYTLSHLDESFDNEDREELRVSAADVENFGTAYARFHNDGSNQGSNLRSRRMNASAENHRK